METMRAHAVKKALIWERLVSDLSSGRVAVIQREVSSLIPGLRVSPLAVVDEMAKKRVILDLSFGYGKRHNSRQGVNGDTGFEAAPPCELGQILYKIIERVCGLQDKFWQWSPCIYIKNGCEGCI